jgi:hypothetical protein
MKYTIGNQTLVMDLADTKEAKGTPNQIVGWRDVAETCRTLDAVCEHIGARKKLSAVDGIARAGFWAAIFRYRWPDCTLHLNEQDKSCVSALKRNFPNAIVTTHDIYKWTPPNGFDLVNLDFDHFTLRILNEWKDVLIAWEESCKYFIIADGACFGFKFGNMKHYGIKTDKEYYYLLDEAFREFMNKRITVVSKFTNAATILCESVRRGKDIKFIESSNIPLSKGGKTYGNYSTEITSLF